MRFLFTILLFLCCKANAQVNHQHTAHQIKKEANETQVLAKIRALPEVKSFLHTANKSELPDLTVDDTPNANNNWRYRIKVGYSSSDMFRSIFIFHVDPKNLNIYYEDFMTESVSDITLQQWRRWRHDPRFFTKMHTFRHGKLVVLKE
jgi:hypothetical protein